MFNKYKKYILLSIGGIFLIGFVCLYLSINKDPNNDLISLNEEIKEEITTKSSINTSFYVDIKGAVKSPGVYLFNEGDKVIDAIEKAGGLTKNGVTSNINLSQKLKSEMVIYIFTKSELTSKTTTNKPITTTSCKCETIEVNNCITTTKVVDSTEEVSSKININTALTNELMSLPGIGESKAKAIIEYREHNGLFNTIEDIKNVSGLGDSIFAKIQDSITV